MKTMVALALAIVIVAGCTRQVPLLSPPQAPVVRQTPAPTAGRPVQLEIPILEVSATVEYVGLDEKQRMDVPKDADHVGWFELGFKPGDKGNAVLAGHLDKENGEPAVFYHVSQLSSGDTFSITDENGTVFTFEVFENTTYPYDQVPLQELFGVSEEPIVNLITCDGVFSATERNYSLRRVIRGRLVSMVKM